MLNANAFLREALFDPQITNPSHFSHRPIVITDSKILLGKFIAQLKVYISEYADDVIDEELFLVWKQDK